LMSSYIKTSCNITTTWKMCSNRNLNKIVATCAVGNVGSEESNLIYRLCTFLPSSEQSHFWGNNFRNGKRNCKRLMM
jgi:hypothetical protein